MIKCPHCEYKKGYDIEHGWINKNDDDFYRSEKQSFTQNKDTKYFNLLICPKCDIVFVDTTSL